MNAQTRAPQDKAACQDEPLPVRPLLPRRSGLEIIVAILLCSLFLVVSHAADLGQARMYQSGFTVVLKLGGDLSQSLPAKFGKPNRPAGNCAETERNRRLSLRSSRPKTTAFSARSASRPASSICSITSATPGRWTTYDRVSSIITSQILFPGERRRRDGAAAERRGPALLDRQRHQRPDELFQPDGRIHHGAQSCRIFTLAITQSIPRTSWWGREEKIVPINIYLTSCGVGGFCPGRGGGFAQLRAWLTVVRGPFSRRLTRCRAGPPGRPTSFRRMSISKGSIMN